jgi:2,5-diketo-D-gluconate reductase A
VPAVNQFELHPYFANDAARAATRRNGIAVEAHSPLGHNGKPLTDQTITAIAAARGEFPRTGHPPLAHAAWPHRDPEIGTPSADAGNLMVFDFKLSAEGNRINRRTRQRRKRRSGPNPDTYEGI